MLGDSSNRKGFLSSQPARDWGETDTKTQRSACNPVVQVQSPPYAARKSTSTGATSSTGSKREDGFSGSISSKSVATSGSSSTAAGRFRPSGTGVSTTAVRGSTSTSSLHAPFQPPRTVKPPPPSSFRPASGNSSNLAPMFRQPTASGSTSSVNRPSASTPSSSSQRPVANASNVGSSSSSSTSLKRNKPWEFHEANSKIAPSSSSSTSNFRNLSNPIGTSSNQISEKLKKEFGSGAGEDIRNQVTLSPEQKKVFRMAVEEGKNVFFTGSAGTGKSVLLRAIIRGLQSKYAKSSDAVAITASTGMAACNIGGTTIHSFSGVGLGVEDAPTLIQKVKGNRTAAGKWSRVKVLVVDEISMVDGLLFDKLAAIAVALKKQSLPFGGIQLIVTGDFFQLPPVTKGANPNFAFEAKSWRECIHSTVNLTQVFRQKDTSFVDMLNEMRFGTLSAESIAKFHACSRDPKYNDGVDPTELFPMRREVDNSNQSRLKALSGELQVFTAIDNAPAGWNGKPNTILESFMAPQRLELKVGAQVMLIKNIDTSLVNGTIGKVIGFGPVEAQEEDDGEMGPVDKKPRLMAGVGGATVEMAPRIEWRIKDGLKGFEEMTMKKEEFKVEDANRKVVASRTQYPLILAWAMSIHKAQGQTLPRVKVDLRKVFEKGQSYVALSRAVSLEGLQVIGFDAKKVMAHPKVVTWSKSLQTL